MVDTLAEKIVMTPKAKSANHTTIVIERKIPNEEKTGGNNVHVAGGDHTGIVVNKVANGELEDSSVAEISLQFLVFLVNSLTGLHTQESRKLLFWFKPQIPVFERPSLAQEFFKELVSPLTFPRDYVGFIKMIMKLMQNSYPTIRKIEVELRQVEQPRELPSRPLSADESVLAKEVIPTDDKILELIEAAYPHPVTVEDLAKIGMLKHHPKLYKLPKIFHFIEHGWDEALVQRHVDSLREKGLIKAMDHGAFTRVIQNDQEIQIVKQMPAMVGSKQPTIAIITAQYCEKLAVDAMLENKETFVRYTTVGESNVYTLGNVGGHRVVCTKLPTLGYTREAMTSAGNTTTRLLGTFQLVDHVFIVGVGGGVPHYTDYYSHVRLGDVVVSGSSPQGDAYSYCEKVTIEKDGKNTFECKNFNPPDTVIQTEAIKLKEEFESSGSCPWETYLVEGLSQLTSSASEHDFLRPSQETDRLYMSIGARDLIEVAHPQPSATDSTDASIIETARLHVGPVGSGRDACRDSRLREEFARVRGLLAVDFESDSVVESVVGNRTPSWAIVRGIADYRNPGPISTLLERGHRSAVVSFLSISGYTTTEFVNTAC